MYPPAVSDLAILQQAEPLPEVAEESTEPVEEEEEQYTEEDIDNMLLELVKKLEKEDIDLRYPLVQKWKRNEYYFNNLQTIFFDEVARDYRTINNAVEILANMNGVSDIKIINIYRAFAESMVAALSVAVPNVEFFPDDAEDPEDINTADVYSKISELIKTHTNASLMQIKGLTTLYNQGVIAAYNYYKTDPSYGTIKTPKSIKKVPSLVADIRCQQCSEMLDSRVPEKEIPPNVNCENCGWQGQPDVLPDIEFIDEVVEWEDTPKGRVAFDVFGPTYVKMPLYARSQETMGYLELRLEDHVAKWRTVYHEFADEIKAGGGDTYLFERWGRIPPEYFGTLPTDLTTARFAWIRPWYFNNLDPEEAQVLTEKYPDGIKVTIIGELIVEKEHEKLDDRWTVTFDPRANFIHAEPAGNAAIPIQDAENDVFNLGLQSIEYGIPETFAHPKTLNLQKYGSSRSAPGMMTNAMPPAPDKALSDGFHTIKAATLSNEYTDFDRSLNEKGQFVTGAFPSIYGGTPQTGSKTAAEYSQSRNQALQRLQLTWKMFTVFWARLMSKCVIDYAKNLREDEKYSKKENGTYVNVWIRTSALKGKVGHVEPEANEQIPQSWAQKKDFFIQLIGMNIPEVGSIVMHPNNSELIKQVTGMPDFYIPGENDRNKQYAEFYLMSTRGDGGQIQEVPIDVDVDDHLVHIQVLKNILVSPVGIQLYLSDPELYGACINHYRNHELAMQAKTMAPAGGSAEGQPAESATQTSQG